MSRLSGAIGHPFPQIVSRSSFPNSSYSGRRPEWASPSSRIFRTPSPRDSRNTWPVRLLRIFERKLTGPAAGAAVSASSRSVLLWGGVGADTVPYLEPAYVIDAPPALPDSAGEFRITGRTAGGGQLFSLSFTMPPTADGDGSSSFAFALPGWAQQDLRCCSAAGCRARRAGGVDAVRRQICPDRPSHRGAGGLIVVRHFRPGVAAKSALIRAKPMDWLE